MGQLRIPEREYEFWTFRQFDNAVRGFYEMEDSKERQAWERVRWSTSVLLNIQLKSNNRIKPEKLLPLPWDAQTKAQQTKKIQKPKPEDWDKWRKEVEGLPTNLKPRRNGI